MQLAEIVIENFRCFAQGTDRFELSLRKGLTALVGENEAGKTAVIDALRFALGTTDQEWYRLEDSDFYNADLSREIRVTCKFEGLTERDKRAFIEYLTYTGGAGTQPILYVNWIAKDTGETVKGRRVRRAEMHAGKDAEGPAIAPEVRELLRATYLRPMRDAEQSLSAGRGSRLSQVLYHTKHVKEAGVPYDPNAEEIDPGKLNVLGIGDLANALLQKQQGIVDTRDSIDGHLKALALKGDSIKSNIKVSGTTSSEDVRLRQLLEKLEVFVPGMGRAGLGSNNLLFMACELLLLSQEEEGNKLLLIEEPEAHLHAQRQLRVMRSLQDQAKEKGIQIIVTTHSPTLASAIELNNLVMIRSGRAFSLAESETQLDTSDYRFLQRFLDVTKANLFFARGVMIVEGDAENILLPTLARIIGHNFTEHGVSIVNVGGVGLRRYARIFQRKDPKQGKLEIPVACLADMDVMPDCAPAIIGRVEESQAWPTLAKRRWRAKKDIGDETALAHYREEKAAKVSGQYVQTYVSDEWTLEYDLALGRREEGDAHYNNLAEDVYVAAYLADKDDAINATTLKISDAETAALKEFAELQKSVKSENGCAAQEVLAASIYAKFARDNVSKAIAAQYLAERLQCEHNKGTLTGDDLRKKLPNYLTQAIDYVTGTPSNPETAGTPANE